MEKSLSNQESLALITQMIHQTKRNYKKSSFYFLLWGWVVITGDLGHYYLIEFTDYPYPHAIWLISIPVWIASAIYGARQSKQSTVKTHLDSLYSFVWISFVVPLLVVIFAGSMIGPYYITGLIMLFAGYAVIITGKLLKFRPTIYGGVVLWITAVLALYFNDSTQYLIGASGVALGYLVPGYMLKVKEDNA
ncbi:MAG: hypothetical protein AAGC88_00370 [Bacteroidota bacterium]